MLYGGMLNENKYICACICGDNIYSCNFVNGLMTVMNPIASNDSSLTYDMKDS